MWASARQHSASISTSCIDSRGRSSTATVGRACGTRRARSVAGGGTHMSLPMYCSRATQGSPSSVPTNICEVGCLGVSPSPSPCTLLESQAAPLNAVFNGLQVRHRQDVGEVWINPLSSDLPRTHACEAIPATRSGTFSFFNTLRN